MKYTLEELDSAIDTILPSIAQAKKAGVKFDRPSLLKDCLVEFVMSGDYEDRRNYDKQLAYLIVRSAMKDLKEFGNFVYVENK